MSAAPRASIALDDARPIWRSMLVFLVPLMLSNVLQSLGQTANSIYLGRLVGLRSLAAVSAIFPIVFFLVSALIGLATGSSVLIGQAFGAGDRERVKQIAGTSIALTLLLGVGLGAVGIVFAREILTLLATPRDVIEISVPTRALRSRRCRCCSLTSCIRRSYAVRATRERRSLRS